MPNNQQPKSNTFLDLPLDPEQIPDSQRRILLRAAEIEDAHLSESDPDRPTIETGLPRWLEMLIILAARLILHALGAAIL